MLPLLGMRMTGSTRRRVSVRRVEAAGGGMGARRMPAARSLLARLTLAILLDGTRAAAMSAATIILVALDMARPRLRLAVRVTATRLVMPTPGMPILPMCGT